MTESKPWYKALYAKFDTYDEEPYTQTTTEEVGLLVEQLSQARATSLLDIGCGTGRHALELASRGYQVTGVDLSEAMITRARRHAAERSLDVDFQVGDARHLPFEQQFDAAILLCEGGFSLVETDEMDVEILESAHRSLKPGGLFIMTSPNAAFMFARESASKGFDPCTCREIFQIEANDEQGDMQVLDCTQRYYTIPELQQLLKQVGFLVVDVFQVSDGYHSECNPTSDDFEFGLICVASS